MKRNLLVFSFVSLAVLCIVSDVKGIGISPARWTNNLLDINPGFNSGMTYSLGRPSTRYSEFAVYDAAGLSGTITGCSTSSGIEYINDSTIMIDWESGELSSTDSITASIHVQSPESWACPVEPGGSSYLTDLVKHSEMAETSSGVIAIAAAVSEISFWRNYAPRTYLQSTATAELAVSLGLQFEDKSSSWFSRYVDRDYNGNPWFSYDIDWDSDGLTDQSGTATFDEEPVPDSKYPSLFRWTSGIQISTLQLGHIYDAAGSYTATLALRDSMETTTLQIPVNVIPEPTTLVLLGLGGLFLRKRAEILN